MGINISRIEGQDDHGNEFIIENPILPAGFGDSRCELRNEKAAMNATLSGSALSAWEVTLTNRHMFDVVRYAAFKAFNDTPRQDRTPEGRNGIQATVLRLRNASQDERPEVFEDTLCESASLLFPYDQDFNVFGLLVEEKERLKDVMIEQMRGLAQTVISKTMELQDNVNSIEDLDISLSDINPVQPSLAASAESVVRPTTPITDGVDPLDWTGNADADNNRKPQSRLMSEKTTRNVRQPSLFDEIIHTPAASVDQSVEVAGEDLEVTVERDDSKAENLDDVEFDDILNSPVFD